MTALTWIHITGGLVALLAGTVAAVAPKGGRAHVAGGIAFALSMFVLGLTAAIIGPSATPPQPPVGGLMVCYFVATGWLAARNRSGKPGAFEKIACAAIVLLGAAMLAQGVLLAMGPPVTTPPPPAAVIPATGEQAHRSSNGCSAHNGGTLSRFTSRPSPSCRR
jgi:MFS family permease